MKKNIFILGSYHGNNLGDLEILDTLISKLYKDYSLTILTTSKFKVASKLPIQYFQEGKIAFVNPFNIFKVLWKLIKSDVVLIGGGGLFFSNNFVDTLKIAGKSQLLYWVKFSILAKLLGKKVFWFGVGIGPLDEFGKFLTKLGAGFTNQIFVRDEYSFELMKKLGQVNKTTLMSDIVYAKQDSRKIKKYLERKTSDIKNVLLIVFDKKNKSKLQSLIDTLEVKKFKLAIAATNPDQDNKFIKNLAKECDLNFIDTSNMNLVEFRNMFNKFDLVISMRMHALLISYQQGVKGFGLSDNLPKVDEIQKQLYGVSTNSNSQYLLSELAEADLKSYEYQHELTEQGFKELIDLIK